MVRNNRDYNFSSTDKIMLGGHCFTIIVINYKLEV